MEIGAVIPHHEIGNDPGAIKAYAEGVEDLGMTHLMIYDHVVGVDRNRPGGFEGPYDSNTAFHEPMVLFGFLAACTTSIDFVTAILILPQRQTVLVAKQAAELAILSGNRFKLGIGVGWNTVEYDALNEDFRTRGKRQEEQVDLMRRLWTEDVFSYDGEYHQFEHASILPRPTEPIPVLFGGSAPALLDRCARLGDGWIPLGTPNDKSDDRIAEMRRVARERASRGTVSRSALRRSTPAAIPIGGEPRPAVGRPRRHPYGDRHPQRRRHRRRRPPRPHRRLPRRRRRHRRLTHRPASGHRTDAHGHQFRDQEDSSGRPAATGHRSDASAHHFGDQNEGWGWVRA